MKALAFLEHHGPSITRSSLGVLSKAADVAGGDVAAVLAGAAPLAVLAEQAGGFGAATVHVAESDAFDPPLPQPRVDVLAELVRAHGYDTVLFATSVLACDVAAGLAARLGAGLNWDLIDLRQGERELVGVRTALQDSVLVDVGWRSAVRLALFRPGSFEPVPTGGPPKIDPVNVTLEPHSQRAKVVGQDAREDGGRSIEDADVVVTGGIGLGGAEHFSLAEDLAAALGGVVGATRAVVYKGWYPRSAQVGQTGTTVAPRLYIALGVSGAVQHKVGMQNSKVIVAINTDPNAPIFEFSDLAVVGDVHTVVPKLVELLQGRTG